MTKALIAGSFDPFTRGHYELVRKASNLFDEVHIVIFSNPIKHYMFTKDERLKILKIGCKDFHNVVCAISENTVANYVSEHKIDVLIRGARNSTDFNYEYQMAIVNSTLVYDLNTIIFPSEPHIQHISSTVVRDLIKHGEDIKGYIYPFEIIDLIEELLYKKEAKD